MSPSQEIPLLPPIVCHPLQVHPDILPYTEESVRKKGVNTLSELEQLYNKEVQRHCFLINYKCNNYKCIHLKLKSASLVFITDK